MFLIVPYRCEKFDKYSANYTINKCKCCIYSSNMHENELICFVVNKKTIMSRLYLLIVVLCCLGVYSKYYIPQYFMLPHIYVYLVPTTWIHACKLN